MPYTTIYDSPLGQLLLTGDGENLTALEFLDEPWRGENQSQPPFDCVKQWLDAYFRGENPEITFSMAPAGTAFQRQVWQLLRQIPPGASLTYGQIAREMAALTGKERMSAQAVGQAVGRNPIPILIPCHRVLGAGRRLTGYACGLDRKRWLLDHENCPYTD